MAKKGCGQNWLKMVCTSEQCCGDVNISGAATKILGGSILQDDCVDQIMPNPFALR